MGLLSSIYTSVSGLIATGTGLSVIGNNVANLNTTGFKSSRMLFSDVYASELDKIGKGSRLHAVTTQFAQGAVLSTGNPLDFAIEGDGFFIVKDSANNKEYYTRAGNFSIQNPAPDKAYIENPDGLRLRGYAADAAGNIVKTLTDIEIPLVQEVDGTGKTVYVPKMQGQATSTATIQLNLNASDDISQKPWTFDPYKGPEADTYNHSITMTVYDSAGNTRPVEIYFRKIDAIPNVGSIWGAHVVWNEGIWDPAQNKITPYYQDQIMSNLTFDTSGNLTPLLGPQPVIFSWTETGGGTLSQTINLNLDNTTQYGSPYSTIFQSIDGYPAGGLAGFRLDNDGILYGKYSNGRERAIAQFVLARFNAPTELNKIGQNLFAETPAAGTRREITPALIKKTLSGGIVESGREVRISNNSLEMSNVDLAEEFVTMIALQKAYNANSVALSTSLEMLKKWDTII